MLINHLISTPLNYESIERFLRSIPDLWFFFDFSVDTTKTFQDHFRANYWNKIKGDRARTSINNNEGLKALEERCLGVKTKRSLGRQVYLLVITGIMVWKQDRVCPEEAYKLLVLYCLLVSIYIYLSLWKCN